MTKVFISYAHKDGDWVRNRLVPVLRAGGAAVLIDREQFRLGIQVLGQMDATQDQAEQHIIVFSSNYLASAACLHELKRAARTDPKFTAGRVLVVKRDATPLPKELAPPNPLRKPLYVTVTDKAEEAALDEVLQACGADLGTSVPAWLTARDEVAHLLGQRKSVNLITENGTKWRQLIEDVQEAALPDLGVVNLESYETVTRPALVEAIIKVLGGAPPQLSEITDLRELGRFLKARKEAILALTHFDMVRHRRHYSIDLFSTLRHCITDDRTLVVLIQSKSLFATLLPAGHPFSDIPIATVPLRATR